MTKHLSLLAVAIVLGSAVWTPAPLAQAGGAAQQGGRGGGRGGAQARDAVQTPVTGRR